MTFLDGTGVQSASIQVCPLRQTKTTTYLRLELLQLDRLKIDATITMTNFSSHRSASLPRLPGFSMEADSITQLCRKHSTINEQVLQSEGWVTRDTAELNSFYKSKPYIKHYFPPGTDLWDSEYLKHPVYGPAVREMWYTFGEKEPFNETNLPSLIDGLTAFHMSFPEGKGFTFITRSMTCEMRKTAPEKGWIWIFSRAELKECSGGDYVFDHALFDDQGEIIAVTRSVSVLMPLAMYKGQVNNKLAAKI